VVRVLEQTGLCAWAPVTPEGGVHINVGYFARSGDLRFYLVSHPRSQHRLNIAANRSMAVAVRLTPEPDRSRHVASRPVLAGLQQE
jgi:hypothetical protein